jgi:hypothetical protein
MLLLHCNIMVYDCSSFCGCDRTVLDDGRPAWLPLLAAQVAVRSSSMLVGLWFVV